VISEKEPLVSIVTSSLNMGRFLEETIRSVIEQDYPNIEYLVMDGGSTDGTLEILKRYEGAIRFLSSPDAGQADAANRGFGLTRGSIFAFLNADDTYLPGAIATVVRAFRESPEAGVVYGNAWHVAEDGRRISPYPVEAFDSRKLTRRCFVCQPAAFIRRDVFESSGRLNPSLRFALDYDLWIRISRRHRMKKIDAFLATSRIHADNKTLKQMGSALRETIDMLRGHYGYVPFNWLYGYVYNRITARPLVFQTAHFSPRSACYSIALGARYNWRYPLRYCRDILSTAREGFAWSRHS
jgi:glycosyltransferase involved in cell wall biosynthesis